MRNDDSAKAFLDDADIIVSETAISLERGHYHRVIRKCQEAAELSVKGLFKYAGIEYPKSHILGRVMKKEFANSSLFKQEELEEMAHISDTLSLDRESSFYGAPDGTPASELYDKEDATDAINKTLWLINKIKKIVK